MRKAIKADTLFGYLIPAVFILFAGYQQITTGSIDKYVIGTLLVFGLGALGWRLDVIFETYLRAKYGPYGPHEKGGPDSNG